MSGTPPSVRRQPPTPHRWDPAAYAANAAFVPALGASVRELLAPKPGERILDLGCGDGVLTKKLQAAGAEVVGVDADPAMVEVALARGIDARVMDGHALTFDGEFDAVFTNAALHWMSEPSKVAAGVFHALRPGGRYVGEVGGRGNIAAIRTAVRAVLLRRGYAPPARERQWYPDAGEFRAVHESAGFVVERADLLYRPTRLPTGMAAWLSTFRMGAIEDAGVAPAELSDVIAEIVNLLRPVLSDENGNWTADYVRLRFVARKPDRSLADAAPQRGTTPSWAAKGRSEAGLTKPFRFAVQVGGAPTGHAWLDLARRMEALGYGTLSMPDHVVGDGFASFPALAAAATVTSQLRVGHLVLDNDFRNPLLLAREALTLDILSGGRLELGLGAGWLEADYDALGLPFDPPAVRLARLAEALTVIKRLCTEDEVTFEGRFYRLTRARALPRAVQRPWPPILVAGGGPRLLEVAAHEADIVGLFVTRHFTRTRALDFSWASAEMQVGHLRAHTAGREVEVNVTITDIVVTDERGAAVAAVARDREQDEEVIAGSPFVLIGTLSEIRDQLVRTRERLGISYFSLRGPAVESVAPVVRELSGS